MPVTVDMTIPETRDFWKAVFLTVLARPDLKYANTQSLVVPAKMIADDAVEALLLRVVGED